MRQVPKYLIIGNGRVARHMCHYFSLLKFKNFSQWDRGQPLSRLHELAVDATHILLAIKDDAIEPFIDQHLTDISACAHIKTLNAGLAALNKGVNAESTALMAKAVKEFVAAHTLTATSRRQIAQIEKALQGAEDPAKLRKLGEGLQLLKAGLPNARRIHFSGSLVTKKAHGAHPLMTFGPEMYPLEKYLSIPFVVDEKAPSFGELFPGLHNPNVRLSPKQKAKYHALCVMSGNFSCLLWQKLFDGLSDEFGIPPHTADMYLRQQTENLLRDYKTALTGPLARGDTETIARNLKALDHDPFQGIFEAFVKAYPYIKQDKIRERKAS